MIPGLQDFDTFQEAAATTVKDSIKGNVTYFALGLCGEAGEVAELVKKSVRDETPLDKNKLMFEVFDTVWYASQILAASGISFAYMAEQGLEKLRSRKERGVISGSGDNR
jgi:NTP pyrophosphatase (non-canonical NTP hydrolase)